jgi:uncharacterized protein with HEPN domain
MRRDETVYLRHILDAMARIEEYVEGLDEGAFRRHKLVQDGVIRQLEIIGEAVKRLSSDLRSRCTDIPWQDMAGMRDKLIHDYLGVDLEKVWVTATEDIPFLKLRIQKLLDQGQFL